MRAVPLPAQGIVTPQCCAGCLRESSLSLCERRGSDGATVIVPYCALCHRQAVAAHTRRLSVIAASTLVGLTVATTLPLALPAMGRSIHLLIAVASSSMPLMLAAWQGKHRFGGTPLPWLDKAAWWEDSEALICVNPTWAKQLADINGTSARACTSRRGRGSYWLLLGPLLALLLAPCAHQLLHASVRILNLTDTPFVVTIQGGSPTRVDTSSSESPSAGAWVRWPTGRRQVEVWSEAGTRIATEEVFVRAGRQHLYAPRNQKTCFWVESDSYGRAGSGRRHIAPLSEGTEFWVLPEIDSWFSPNPTKTADNRSTGGTLHTLRQAECDEAPPQARKRQPSGGPTTEPIGR